MRDGVHADMTRLASTNESTIFWVQSRLGVGAHVEHLDPVLARAMPTVPADELGAQHRELGVVDGDDRLLAGRRHDEQVREAAAHHPEEAGGAVGPLLGQRDAVPADDVVAGAAGQRRDLGLEAGAVDDAVDLVLLAVDDRAPLGDPLDAGRAVDEGDVGAVERLQVLVVEARPLAEVPVVRLEDSAARGIGHQLLDPLAVLLHDPVVELLGLADVLLDASCPSGGAGGGRRRSGGSSRRR